MSTSKETVERLKSLLSDAGDVRIPPMFGEYGLYLNDKFIGVVADDLLFLKKTEAGERMIGPGHEAPPYPGASMCFCVPEERLQDSPWLCEFLQTTEAALPVAKPKKKRQKG
jgi:TfoX/Sxy family transcriptional regulator of competence genes